MLLAVQYDVCEETELMECCCRAVTRCIQCYYKDVMYSYDREAMI